MEERVGVGVVGGAGFEVEGSEAKDPVGVHCGLRGRRSVDDRTEAIVEMLSGKATVDHLAFRFGVHPKTVERWREVALEGIEQFMRQGSGESTREKELERKLGAVGAGLYGCGDPP